MSLNALAELLSSPEPSPQLLQGRLADISRVQAAEARTAAEARGARKTPEWDAGCRAFEEGEVALVGREYGEAASAYGWAAGAFLRATPAPVVAPKIVVPAFAPAPVAIRPRRSADVVVPAGFSTGSTRRGPGASLALALVAAAGVALFGLRTNESPSAAIAPPTPAAVVVPTPVAPPEVLAPPPPVAAVPDLPTPPALALAPSPDDAPPVINNKPLGEWLRRYAVAWGGRDVLALQRLGVLISRVEAQRLSVFDDTTTRLRATVRNVKSRAVGERTVVSFDRTLTAVGGSPVTDHLTFVLQPGPQGLVAFVPGRDEDGLANLAPTVEYSNVRR